MASITKQEGPQKMSKKQFSRTVFARLTSSLADFNLKEKKLENRLKKVSKQLAADIIKTKKTKEQDTSDKEQGTDEKVKDIRVKHKKAKENKVAAAE